MPASDRPYMGAIAYAGGVTFRVWAPFARSVCVAGTFNDWSSQASPLFSEGNGCWSVDDPGANVLDEYKFVIEDVSGDLLWKNDPYARELTQSRGNSVIAETYASLPAAPSDYRTPTWDELVIYELHVGTFVFDPTSRKGRGTFRSVTSKLDYLRDLGINAIEIMASGEYLTDISWGYNPSYIFAIESDYGGPNGFRSFVNAAHERGIAVIADVVYNHLGPTDLDLWQFDGWHEDGHGGIYFYNDERRVTPWGDTRPDYGRPEVRQYLCDNALRWLEQRYADGLRWDATGWIRNIYGNNDPSNDIPDGWRLMQWINDQKNQRQPWKLSIAEDLQQNDWITRNTAAGGAGFDAQWDAAFVHPVRRAITPASDDARDLFSVRDAIRFRYNDDALHRVIYTESRDEVANGKARVPEEIWPGNASSWFSKKRSILGAALVFTAPGIPMIFQGQEFLEDRWFDDGVELDWHKSRLNAGICTLYRDFIRLRRNWFDNTRGLRGEHVNVYHVNNTDKLLAFHRWEHGGAGDDVVVVMNFANRGYDSYNLGFPREGFWRVRLNTDWSGYSSSFSNASGYDTAAYSGRADDMPCNANIGIGPYSVLILSQDH
jgi:1,4-alpha-glucan branching enzyme